MFAGARAARHDGAADAAAGERDFRFNGGIAARIDDLAGVNFGDAGELHKHRLVTQEIAERAAACELDQGPIGLTPHFTTVSGRKGVPLAKARRFSTVTRAISASASWVKNA